MAFLEQVGKRISDVGEGVAQQTKKIADIAHLNASISEKEKRLVQLYTALGQAYYEKHKKDSTAEEKELMTEILTLRRELKEEQEEVKQLRGIVKGQNCGAEAAAEQKVCPRCHAVVKEGNRFCSHCGEKI